MRLQCLGRERKESNHSRQELYWICMPQGRRVVWCALQFFMFSVGTINYLSLDTEVQTPSTLSESHYGRNLLCTAAGKRSAGCRNSSNCMFLHSYTSTHHCVLTSLPSQAIFVLTSVIIYGCYLHPLAHVPGPFLAKFSPVRSSTQN